MARSSSKSLAQHPGPPDAPTPVFLTFLPSQSVIQGPWVLLDSDSPPASRPSLRLPLPLQVVRHFPTCLTRRNVTWPWRPSSKSSSPYCLLQFLSRPPWNLALSCLWVYLYWVSLAPGTRQGSCLFSAAPPAPGPLGLSPPSWHSLAKIQGVGPVTGTWSNQLLKDTAQLLFHLRCSNSICFPCLSWWKALSDR